MREYIRIAFGANPVRKRSAARRALMRALAPAARMRLRNDRYDMPMELWLLRSLIRLKSALGMSLKTHVVQS